MRPDRHRAHDARARDARWYRATPQPEDHEAGQPSDAVVGQRGRGEQAPTHEHPAVAEPQANVRAFGQLQGPTSRHGRRAPARALAMHGPVFVVQPQRREPPLQASHTLLVALRREGEVVPALSPGRRHAVNEEAGPSRTKEDSRSHAREPRHLPTARRSR